jgi:hypothetical protein
MDPDFRRDDGLYSWALLLHPSITALWRLAGSFSTCGNSSAEAIADPMRRSIITHGQDQARYRRVQVNTGKNSKNLKAVQQDQGVSRLGQENQLDPRPWHFLTSHAGVRACYGGNAAFPPGRSQREVSLRSFDKKPSSDLRPPSPIASQREKGKRGERPAAFTKSHVRLLALSPGGFHCYKRARNQSALTYKNDRQSR